MNKYQNGDNSDDKGGMSKDKNYGKKSNRNHLNSNRLNQSVCVYVYAGDRTRNNIEKNWTSYMHVVPCVLHLLGFITHSFHSSSTKQTLTRESNECGHCVQHTHTRHSIVYDFHLLRFVFYFLNICEFFYLVFLFLCGHMRF